MAVGAQVHGAGPWHHAGFKGQGVKVGIIDVGFDGYEQLAKVGDNPYEKLPYVRVQEDNQWCYQHLLGAYPCFVDTGIYHGTAVAEAIIDIAPEARLYLTAPINIRYFVDSVDWLIKRRGVDVIVQARAWPYDGAGDGYNVIPNLDHKLFAVGLEYVGNVVQEALESGVIWVNSAGNETKKTWAVAAKYHTTGATPGSFQTTRVGRSSYINFDSADPQIR